MKRPNFFCSKRWKYYAQRLGNNSIHVAASLTNLAVSLQKQGEYREAEELLREALEICRRRPPDEQLGVAYVLYSLAKLMAAKGEFVTAEEQIREALEIFQGIWAEGNSKLLRAKNVLGDVLVGLERYHEAEMILLEIYPALAGNDSIDALHALKSLVGLYEAWGRPEHAARYRAQLDAG